MKLCGAMQSAVVRCGVVKNIVEQSLIIAHCRRGDVV